MKKKQLKSLGIFMGVVLTSFIYTHVDADTLTVPKTADKVIIDSTEHVKYVDSNGVELVAKDGTTYEVPLTVDKQVISNIDGQVEGVTEYTTDLANATAPNEGNKLLNYSLGLIGGSKVYAQDFEYGTSKWDSTISVKINTKVYWSKSGINAKVTKVTGGYHVDDLKIGVKGSSLRVYSNGLTDNQETSFDLGKSSTWSRTISHHYVKSNNLSSGGALYVVNLVDANSSWNVALANQAWVAWAG